MRAVQGSVPHVYKLSSISQQPLKLKASSWNNLSAVKRGLSHRLRKFPTHEESPSLRTQVECLKQEQAGYPSMTSSVKHCVCLSSC